VTDFIDRSTTREPVRVLVLSASLREESLNSRLARLTARCFEGNGAIVECSWHFGTFDVTTGAALSMPCETPLKTYPVHVEDGIIHVEI